MSIYAPQNRTNLPVLVYIHGGGYGQGAGNVDFSSIINTNNNDFVGVALQYRLGAFGFLSSDEVYRYGTVNAGLKDVTFALQWVQAYIGLFGGNASAVTISGESAGGMSRKSARVAILEGVLNPGTGGQVMLQTMAFGGELGNSLFRQVGRLLTRIVKRQMLIINRALLRPRIFRSSGVMPILFPPKPTTRLPLR